MLRKTIAGCLVAAAASIMPFAVSAQEDGLQAAGTMSPNDYRIAARAWSLGVAERAQAKYHLGPVRMGLEGRVRVRFRVTETGATEDCSIINSSGAAELDAIVCDAVAASGPAPIKRGENGQAEAVWAVLPVAFVLQ